MRVLIKNIFGLYLLLISMGARSQDKCKTESVYTTDSVGNSSFKIPQKFFYKVANYSVKVFLGGEVSIPMLDFRITKKECYKEADSVSYTIQLDLVYEEAGKSVESKLRIRCNYLGAYQIELLYPNKEDRIFYIDQQKAYLRNK